MNDTFTYKSRAEVPEKYKWDLTTRYKTTKDWDEHFARMQNEINKISEYQGKILKNPQNLYDCLELYTKIELELNELYVYAYLKKDENLEDAQSSKMYQKIYSLFMKFIQLSSFIIPEILKENYKKILNYISEDKRLKKYEKSLEDIFRTQKHILSDENETIIAKLSANDNVHEQIAYNLIDSELKYGYITVEGKKEELTNANFVKFIKNKDRKIRKKATLLRNSKLKEFQNTLALNLITNLKKLDVDSKLHHYKNYFEAKMFEDKIPEQVYFSLLKFVEDNLDVQYRLYDIRKKCLKVDKLYSYDLAVDLIKNYDKKYSIEEAQKIVINTTKILGNEYNEIIKQAFRERWIDYCSYKSKASGGYQISNYKNKPNILMHYQGLLTDISTIAHESGHAVHSYLANKNNNEVDANYSIFVAEVASLTNEILLSHYILKNSDDKYEKISSVYNILEVIMDNFFGASKQAEFEYKINEMISKEESLSYEELNNLWKSLSKKYGGKNIILGKASEINWCRITHFFSPFYTYKYATGITCACYIATNIINETDGFKEKYINFLKSGGKKDSLELLNDLGIDLTKEKTFEITTNLLNKLMDNFEELYKEVNDE